MDRGSASISAPQVAPPRGGPEERRRRLRTPDAASLLVHDHVAWCGDGPEPLASLAVDAFSAAVERGEQMFLVSDDVDRQGLAGLAGVDDLMATGALQVRSVRETYGASLDADAQRSNFEELVESALAEGYTGICVVADNSSLAAGSDAEFAAWLRWEAAADALQASRPVVGVCYFDRRRVPSERLADLSVMHPVLSVNFTAPHFQLFVDGDTVRLVGALDYFCVQQLRRILAAAPEAAERVLDVSEVEFFHHGALWALNETAGCDRPVRLLGARDIVQRVWRLLDLPSPALEFC